MLVNEVFQALNVLSSSHFGDVMASRQCSSKSWLTSLFMAPRHEWLIFMAGRAKNSKAKNTVGNKLETANSELWRVPTLPISQMNFLFLGTASIILGLWLAKYYVFLQSPYLLVLNKQSCEPPKRRNEQMSVSTNIPFHVFVLYHPKTAPCSLFQLRKL